MEEWAGYKLLRNGLKPYVDCILSITSTKHKNLLFKGPLKLTKLKVVDLVNINSRSFQLKIFLNKIIQWVAGTCYGFNSPRSSYLY